MFKNKKVIQIVVSGVMALLFVNFYLKNKERAIDGSFSMVEVLAAARDIPPRTLLSPEYLTTKSVPTKYVEPGAVIVKIPEQALKRIQGKVTVAATPAGAQITLSNLASPSMPDTSVGPLIPPGKRGYLLRLGNMDVADLILPGDHIDIMATFTIRQKESNHKGTFTILQNILVIAVGRQLRKSNEETTAKDKNKEGLVITLALEPTQAERLALAQSESQGEIAVIVRPHGDNDIKPVPGVTPGNLLG